MRAPMSRSPLVEAPDAPAIAGIINGLVGAVALWTIIAGVALALS